MLKTFLGHFLNAMQSFSPRGPTVWETLTNRQADSKIIARIGIIIIISSSSSNDVQVLKVSEYCMPMSLAGVYRIEHMEI